MKVDILEQKIELPNDVQAEVQGSLITIKGPKGEVKREIKNPKVNAKLEDGKITLFAKKATKREKKEVHTYKAHIINMIKGSTNGHLYELKICSGHFPMNVSISGNELIIKNFIGEKHPRKLKLKEGVSVKIEGDKIIVENTNKELAGQTAADIEKLTKRPGFDTRIFQDGIYIIKKDGKELE